MNEAATLVEFIGGPCDGYNMTMQPELPRAVAIPLNQNVFRVLGGQKSGPPLPCETIAFYKLANPEDGRYRFLGACRTSDLNVKDWAV
jgi:hypothetical protein